MVLFPVNPRGCYPTVSRNVILCVAVIIRLFLLFSISWFLQPVPEYMCHHPPKEFTTRALTRYGPLNVYVAGCNVKKSILRPRILQLLSEYAIWDSKVYRNGHLVDYGQDGDTASRRTARSSLELLAGGGGGAPTPQTNLFQWCPSSRFWWTFERPRPLCRRQIVDYPGTDLFLFIKPAPQFPDIAGSRGLMKTHTPNPGKGLRLIRKRKLLQMVFDDTASNIFQKSKHIKLLPMD